MAYGQKTYTTTAAQLSSAVTTPVGKVKIKAAPGNSDNLYVGLSSGVTSSTGWILDANEEIELEVNTLGEVWVIGGAASQVAQWIATPRPIHP